MEEKSKDKWWKGEGIHEREHNVPREGPLDPTGRHAHGPSLENLSDVRTTHMVFPDGTRLARTDNWRSPDPKDPWPQGLWRGKTCFFYIKQEDPEAQVRLVEKAKGQAKQEAP